MKKSILAQLDRRYTLDTQLHSLNLQRKETEADIRQAKWNLRCQQQKQVEYESSLRYLLDRLRGKREEAEEAFHREIRQEKEKLAELSRKQERIAYQINQLSQQEEGLPTAEQLRDAAEQEPEARARWADLEFLFCANMLLPLLKENEDALNEYRAQLRGEHMGQVMSREEFYEVGTAHLDYAVKCAALLERMRLAAQKKEEAWEIPGYFQNPNGFIVAAAARHNRLDRVNTALDQIYAMKKRVSAVLREREE